MSIRYPILLTILVTSVALAAPAQAAAPSNAALQRQVRVLQKQVKALTDRLAHEEQSSADRDNCLFALNKDSFRSFFHTLARVVAQITNTTPAPDQPRFDDQGACARLGIPRP